MPTNEEKPKIKRVYIKNGFNDESKYYDIGMDAINVDYDNDGTKVALQTILQNHLGSMVFSEAGAHGIRYFDKKLSVWDGTRWYEIPIGGDIGLDLDPVSAVSISTFKHTATICWTDPSDILLPDGQHAIVKWAGTRILRRTDRSPDLDNGEDGDVIFEEERNEDLPNQGRNTYAIDGYENNNLSFGQKYFYALYSYKLLSNGDKVFSRGVAIDCIPTPVTIDTVPYQINIPTYNGETQYPTFEGNGDPDAFTITGELSGLYGRLEENAYQARFTPTEDYVWSPALGGGRETKNVGWVIKPIEISAPSIDNTNLTYIREGGEGKEQGPTIGTYDPAQINISDNIGVDAKQYHMKLSLINPSLPDTKYVWINGSREDQIVDWIINRKELTKPDAEIKEFVYNGKTIELVLEDFDEDYMTKAGCSGIDADSYEAEFELLGNTINNEHPEQNQINCCWIGGSISKYSFSWAIGAKYVDRPRVTKDLVYNGQAQNISEYLEYDDVYSILDNPENLVGTDAEDEGYTLTFSLNQPSGKRNLKWKDAGDYPYTPKNVTWYIRKAPNENWTLNFSYKNGMLPYKFYRGSSVIYNGKIHILGGNLSDTTKKHYSYDGTQWKEESTLPYDFSKGGAVVYNDKIYIFGSDATTVIPNTNPSLARSRACYSWDPVNGWNRELDLPYDFIGGCAVLCKDKVYLIGGGSSASKSVFSWDFNSSNGWNQEADYVQNFKDGTALTYHDKIYVMGGSTNTAPATYGKFAYYDDTTETWTTDSNLATGVKLIYGSQATIEYNDRIYLFAPTTIKSWGTGENSWKIESFDIPPYGTNAPYMTGFYGGNAIILKDGDNQEIHLLGGSTASGATDTNITQYHYNGTSVDDNLKWELENLAPPYKLINGCTVVYHNKIHILGGGTAGNTNHYSFNGKTWDKESTLPYNFYNGCATVYNDKIYIMGGTGNGSVPGAITPVVINQACYSWPNEGESPWKQEPSLKNRFYNGGSFVYDNKLFIAGGGGSTGNTEQKRLQYLDTENRTWEVVTSIGGTQINLPATFSSNMITVYNNKVYVIINKTVYSSDLTGPFIALPGTLATTTTGGQAFEYNNRLHILGGSGGTTKHYSLFTGPIIDESTLPEELNKECAIVYQNKIIFIGDNDLYVYNNSSSTWNSYGSINFDTVTQEVFFHNLITVKDSLSDGKIVFLTPEEEEFKMENYCDIIENKDEHTFYFKLNNTLFETSELNGIKTVDATIQIGESKNYKASQKQIPLNIVGIEVSDNTKWNVIKDKPLEMMIKARDYKDNEGEGLKVLNPNNPQQKIPFDLQKYWSIGSTTDYRIIPHLGGTNFKNVAFGANSAHRWVILDFIDIKVTEEDTVPAMVIGMLGCLSSSTTASLAWAINNTAESGDYPISAPWLQSGAKATCDNFYNVFQLNFLIKERYNIGKIFLPSEKEILGNTSQGEDDGTSQFAYYAVEGNSKKYAGTDCSKALTNGYWTRTPSRNYPKNYAFANADGEVSAAVSSGDYTKGYSLVTCI